MENKCVTAEAGANIAFIKYWGNRGVGKNLPLNASISMTLASCVTRTTVEALPDGRADEILLDGRMPDEKSARRISGFVEMIRAAAGRRDRVRVESVNTFPSGCGIASSASGFAALALAAARAFGLKADEAELSRMARLGSGSAARSVPGGFVELCAGETHDAACAVCLAPETWWPELRDVVVVVSLEEKAVSSAEGHRVARTSEMLAGRLRAVAQRAEQVRNAILSRDLAALGQAAEADALSMHAVMMTSRPSLIYWCPQTLDVIRCVLELREGGTGAWFTIDAGPNVHVLTDAKDAGAVEAQMKERGWTTILDRAGAGARILEGASV